MKNPAKWLRMEELLRALPLFPKEQASPLPLTGSRAARWPPGLSVQWGALQHRRMAVREHARGCLVVGAQTKTAGISVECIGRTLALESGKRDW